MKTLFFLISIAAVVLGVKSYNEITSAMEKHEVIPDVVSDGATKELKVSYGNAKVHMGNVLTPTETKNKPDHIDWNADDNGFYTLIFTAPDGPSRANPKFREVIKWLVVNIPGGDIGKGEVLADYIGAAPEKDVGLSRYVYLVYRQQAKETFVEKPINKHNFNRRKHFSTRKFIRKYRMGPKAVAADFFQARYDNYVPFLYKQIHYKPRS